MAPADHETWREDGHARRVERSGSGAGGNTGIVKIRGTLHIALFDLTFGWDAETFGQLLRPLPSVFVRVRHVETFLFREHRGRAAPRVAVHAVNLRRLGSLDRLHFIHEDPGAGTVDTSRRPFVNATQTVIIKFERGLDVRQVLRVALESELFNRSDRIPLLLPFDLRVRVRVFGVRFDHRSEWFVLARSCGRGWHFK